MVSKAGQTSHKVTPVNSYAFDTYLSSSLKGKQKAVSSPKEPSSPDVPRSLFSESPPSSPGIPLASKSLATKPLPAPPRLNKMTKANVVPPPQVPNLPRPPTFPPPHNTTTSGIPTKQRLAEKALMPVKPGITRPSITIPRNLSSLRINKTPSVVTPKSASGPNQDAKPRIAPPRNISTSSVSTISPIIPSAGSTSQSYTQ